MGATTEAHQQPSEEYRASSLKKPLTFRRRNLRLSLEPDGSVRSLESMSERRLLFGREQIALYRGKAGILLQAQRPEWRLRLTPYQSTFSATVFDSIECSESIGILPGAAEGYYRALAFRNRAAAPARLRMICLQDPTAAHFRDSQFAWGSLGVNAFNRSTHVALDEVASPPSARILGSKPGPKLIHMTTDRGKAAELIAAGELPEQTAGMTGQVIVLFQYDLEIPAGSEVRLSLLAVYDQSRLETALSNFDRLIESGLKEDGPEFDVASSSPSVTAAAKWAVSALEGACYEPDSLDRYEVLRSLPFVDPDSAKAIIENAKAGIAKDGSVGHSSYPAKPGLLETAALLEGCCILGALSSEKKYSRSAYSTARRLAGYLGSSSPSGVVKTDSSLPQGWRRRIGKGYPTGEIPEVSLAVASAMKMASALATRVRKLEEAGRWAESSRLVVQAVKERAIDERGVLSLSLDGDRMRTEETVDQAVACYRFSPGSEVESHVVRRLLEKDFECGWGPRTIPTSNRTYFNPSYGEGQLGGYWTRAALAHAIAAYRAGLAGIGGIELESIARLPALEAPKLGGAPGEFPYWIDPQRRETHGQGSDPVSASRFLEALIRCEVGLEFGSGGLEVKPGNGSRLKWLLITGLYAGRRACVFVGRAAGASFAFVGLPDCRVENGWNFSGSERATADERTFAAASFYSPGQTICVGNSSDTSVMSRVSFGAREPSLSRHLSVKLERFDPKTGSWENFSSVRVLSPMSFEVPLGPLDWGAFRLSTGS
jgi:hypothetical protein